MSVSTRTLAQQLAALERKVDALSRPQLAHSSLEDGTIEEYDLDGNLVARIGRQPDGSHGVVVLDGPNPLRPTTPTADGRALALAVRWDGNFIDPASGSVDASLQAYDDFRYIEVHVGDVVSFVPSPGTLAGYILSREGGEVEVPSLAGTVYVKLVTRATSGKASVPSTAAEATVSSLVDREQFENLDRSLAEAQADLESAQTTLNAAFPSGAFNVAATIDAETAAARAAAEAAAAIDAAAKAEAAKDAAIAAAAQDAQAKADAAASAAQTAAQQYAEAEAEAARLAAIAAASDDATAKAAAAQAAAEAAAAADALAKAQAAEAAAIAEAESLAAAAEAAAKSHADTVSATAKAEALTEAAADAQAKANAAKAAAEAAAKQYADGAISASETAVLQQAATSAQEMADAAEAAAKQAAAIDAQQKANAAASAAEAAAKQYADGEIDAAALATAQQAAADAQAKANAARDAAITAAAADATAKANAAQALAQQHADGLFDDAMTAVNGKNLITYAGIARGAAIPTTPPPTTGRVAGDIHRVRYTDNGEIAREWTLIGSSFVQVKFGDAILTSLDVGKLVAGTANVDTAVINKMAVQMADIIEADIGNLRVTGTAEMDTLVAQAIASETGEFIEIVAEQITGGTINAALDIAAGGKLTVGSTTQPHVEIGNGKIQALRPGQFAPIPTVTMGGVEDAFRVLDAQGNLLGGINPDGSMLTPALDAGTVRVGGDDVRELIRPKAEGTVVWSNYQDQTVGPYSERTGVWEMGFNAVGGRRYRIDVTADWRSDGNSAIVTGLTKTQSETGTAPAPLVTSPDFTGLKYVETQNSYRHAVVTWWFMPARDEHARFLWFIQPFAGSTVRARNFTVVVSDYGINPDNTGRPSLGGASGSTVPPTPPTQDYVKTFTPTAHHIWSQYGKGDTYAPQWVRSGTHSSFSSGAIYRTYIPFPSDMLSAISGAASVAKVEVRLSQVSGWNGSPTASTFTATSFTSEPSVANTGTIGAINYGETKWLTLTSAQVAAIKAGAKGIALGLRTAVTNQDFYGPSASSSLRPVFRVSYTA